MRNYHVGTNFTIFLLFFGLSLLEAIRAHSWLMAAFWASFGALFLVADWREQRGVARR